jgi:hypothetical protein
MDLAIVRSQHRIRRIEARIKEQERLLTRERCALRRRLLQNLLARIYLDERGDRSIEHAYPTTVSTSREDCPICLTTLFHTEVRTLCGGHHRFHRACIDRWIHTEKTCPMCRSPLTLNRSSNNDANMLQYLSLLCQEL